MTLRTSKSLAGSIIPTSAITWRISVLFAGVLTPTGSAAKRVAKQLAGAITSLVGSLLEQGGVNQRPSHLPTVTLGTIDQPTISKARSGRITHSETGDVS